MTNRAPCTRLCCCCCWHWSCLRHRHTHVGHGDLHVRESPSAAKFTTRHALSVIFGSSGRRRIVVFCYPDADNYTDADNFGEEMSRSWCGAAGDRREVGRGLLRTRATVTAVDVSIVVRWRHLTSSERLDRRRTRSGRRFVGGGGSPDRPRRSTVDGPWRSRCFFNEDRRQSVFWFGQSVRFIYSVWGVRDIL